MGPDDEIDHIAIKAVYRQLAEILAARIERGDWKPGSRLPAEDDIADEYGVAKGTVRAALRVLREEMDLVQTAPQRGSFVKAQKN